MINTVCSFQCSFQQTFDTLKLLHFNENMPFSLYKILHLLMNEEDFTEKIQIFVAIIAITIK